jgi:hypothetical protein
MSGSILRWGLLIAAFALLALMAGARDAATRRTYSFYSTYDTGPNGYRALYELLGTYNIPTVRFDRELVTLDADVETLVISDYTPDMIAGVSEQSIDAHDATFLKRFVQNGGHLIVLMHDVPDALSDAFPPKKNELHHAYTHRKLGRGEAVFANSPAPWSNAQIDRGNNAHDAFELLAGRGPVAFDESLHGHEQSRSMWGALPKSVHVAVWIACLMVVLWLVEANIRIVPPTPLEPPDERDSSAYIHSMAQLLQRARAGAHVIARFYDEAKRRAGAGDELEHLSHILAPSDAQVVRAARIAAELRKGTR